METFASIIGAVLPVVLKLIALYLDKINADKKAKLAFLNFIKELEPQNASCMRLRKSYESQLEALNREPN